MTNTRECKACDGRGDVCCYDATVGFVGTCKSRCYRCDSACEVCDGSGQIRESIPASDAIADAETLRNQWRSMGWLESASAISTTLKRQSIATVPDWMIAEWTKGSTSAAFRAVPGLRG